MKLIRKRRASRPQLRPGDDRRRSRHRRLLVEPLEARCLLATLALSFDDAVVSEADGYDATTATVSRDGDLSSALVVTINNPDRSELFLPATVTIPASSASTQFAVHVVNDGDIDGDQVLDVVVSAAGYDDGIASITVLDDDTEELRTLGGHLIGTIAEGTYQVLFDIHVEAGHTLTIEPGSVLEFDAGVELEVAGQLLADGELGSEIVFTSSAPAPAPGDWDGLKFVGATAASSLSHVEIAYATNGVQVLHETASKPLVTVSDSTIRQSLDRGVFIRTLAGRSLDGTDVAILNSVITGSTNGTGVSVHAVGSNSQNNARIEGNVVSGHATNGISVSAQGGTALANSNASPLIKGNLVTNNADRGVSLFVASNGVSSARVVNNVIRENPRGVWIEFGVGGVFIAPEVINNTILHNTEVGIHHFTTGTFPIIRNNIVALNQRGIRAASAFVPFAGTVGFNDVWNNPSGNWTNYPITFGAMTTTNANGDPVDAHGNISLDPQFIDAAELNFRPRVTSPVIDAGTSDAAPADDFDGVTRQAPPDIGAFETINTPPSDILLSQTHIMEEELIGTLVGVFTTVDPDVGDIHIYALVSGDGSDDNESFVIDGDQLNTAEEFDFATQQSYSIRVQTTDFRGASFEKQFTITVEPKILGGDDIVTLRANGDWVLTRSTGRDFTEELWGNWPTDVDWQHIVTGDFTGNGLTDIAGWNPDTGEWSVAASTGNSFVTEIWGHWSTIVDWDHVMVGDFDGDGIDDLVGRHTNGRWMVSLSSGEAFSSPQIWGRWSPAVQWEHVMIGDFDGDGMADIIGRHENGRWLVARSTGAEFENEVWGSWRADFQWEHVMTGDFDGDGRTDIIGRHVGNGRWLLGLSRETEAADQFENAVWGSWRTDFQWDFVMTGDFDGDGRTDIVGRHENGRWLVGLSRETDAGGEFQFEVWESWRTDFEFDHVMTGDFNSNGRTDIVGRHENGRLLIARSMGNGFAKEVWGAWPVGLNPLFVAVGNFALPLDAPTGGPLEGSGEGELSGFSTLASDPLAPSLTGGVVPSGTAYVEGETSYDSDSGRWDDASAARSLVFQEVDRWAASPAPPDSTTSATQPDALSLELTDPLPTDAVDALARQLGR